MTAARAARYRFSNALRYRDPGDPAQTQLTPEYILGPVREDLGGSIGLDPCTTAGNPAGADWFYTPFDDGLDSPWAKPGWSPSVFVNPPYGKAREPWVTRCARAGARGQRVVLLIPAATDTVVFQRAAALATAVVFTCGRVKFGVLRPNRRQAAASHPSALIGWNTGLDACSDLGLRVRADQPRTLSGGAA